jgi:hypothetical protein
MGIGVLLAIAGAVGIVEGTVRERATGAPVPDAVVELLERGSAAPVELLAASDGQGHYRIEGVPVGAIYDVHVYAAGMQDAHRRVGAGERTIVDLALDAEPRPESTGLCFNDGDCPRSQVCSVSLGDCGGAAAPADVCTGVCRDGWIALAGRAQAVALTGSGPGATAALGLEAIPPWLGGRLSLAADWWTSGAWRLGGALWLRPHAGVAISARVDGVRTDGAWRPAVAARVEWSPIWPWSRIGRWGHASLLAEVGVLVEHDDRALFGSLAVAFWLGLP